MKRACGFLVASLITSVFTPLRAADVTDLTWATTDGEVTITDCKQSATGELVIPSTLDGNPVTGIGDGALFECTTLTGIRIAASSSIRSISPGIAT